MSSTIIAELVAAQDSNAWHLGQSTRQADECAIEEEEMALPAPLPHPHLLAISPSGQGIRRRASDINRLRPLNLQNDIELVSFPQPAAVRDDDLSPGTEYNYADLGSRAKDLDVEIAPSLPQSQAASVVLHDETDSTAPVVTAFQKAAQRRHGRIHFAVLCWNFFLAGWNDGSTGPLLPTVQRYYNVRLLSFIAISH